MLTGADLPAGAKELGDVSKSDLVRSCGDVSTKKDGREPLNCTIFYGAPQATKVQFNDDLLVGKAHTAQQGLEPDDGSGSKLGRKQRNALNERIGSGRCLSLATPITPSQIRPFEAADCPAVWALLAPVFRAGETFPEDPAISEAEA